VATSWSHEWPSHRSPWQLHQVLRNFGSWCGQELAQVSLGHHDLVGEKYRCQTNQIAKASTVICSFLDSWILTPVSWRCPSHPLRYQYTWSKSIANHRLDLSEIFGDSKRVWQSRNYWRKTPNKISTQQSKNLYVPLHVLGNDPSCLSELKILPAVPTKMAVRQSEFQCAQDIWRSFCGKMHHKNLETKWLVLHPFEKNHCTTWPSKTTQFCTKKSKMQNLT